MMLWVVLVALCVLPAVLLWKYGGAATLGGVAGVALIEAAVCVLLLFRQAEKHAVMKV